MEYTEMSAFTLAYEAAKQMSGFLESNGYKDASSWRLHAPRYHCEVCGIVKSQNEASLEVSQLERVSNLTSSCRDACDFSTQA